MAFIAGGSSGINLGIAQHFARHGAKIALIGRSEEKILAAATTITDEGHEAFGMAADVRDFAAVDVTMKQAHDHYGTIDIVVPAPPATSSLRPPTCPPMASKL